MSDAFASTHPAEIASFVGKHIIYAYAGSGLYEVYLKNDRTFDYRIHGGPFAGSWFKGQEVHIARIGVDMVKISWVEDWTGASASVTYNFAENLVHGVTFLPRWITLDPKKIIGAQHLMLDQIRRYRDEGPHLPMSAVDEFATITFVEDCGRDDDSVIACAPEDLPAGYATRKNVG